METWIDSEQKYQGKIIPLRVGSVRLDNGSVVRREVVEHPGGVAIVPVKGGAVILARQFRISIGRETSELPAGRLEAQESPRECASREMEEELGYQAVEVLVAEIGSKLSNNGFEDSKTIIGLQRLVVAIQCQKLPTPLEAAACECRRTHFRQAQLCARQVSKANRRPTPFPRLLAIKSQRQSPLANHPPAKALPPCTKAASLIFGPFWCKLPQLTTHRTGGRDTR